MGISVNRASVLKGWLLSLSSLIFPRRCACCSTSLLDGEVTICTTCRYDMPLTGYYNRKENAVVEKFAGRVMFDNASALMFFDKHSHYRDLIHRMKYSGRGDIARTLGEIYGSLLASSELYRDIDTVIPVPLHFTKTIKRGYNQSAEFACGVAKSLGVEVERGVLVRSRRTNTQARQRTVESRFSNVQGAFRLRNVERLRGKRVLLVDDIITSGSTLEACADIINRRLPELRLSLGAIAFVR